MERDRVNRQLLHAWCKTVDLSEGVCRGPCAARRWTPAAGFPVVCAVTLLGSSRADSSRWIPPCRSRRPSARAA